MYRAAPFLACVVLLGVLAACTGSSSDKASPASDTASASNAGSTSDPGSTSAPIPCATPSPAAPKNSTTATPGPSSPDWAGVYQTVSAVLKPDGTKDKTPSESTDISVTGSKPISLQIPVSTSKVKVKHAGHFKNKIPTPTVKNGKAEVNMTPQGVADETLTSSFAHPLPVTVALSYKFNGKAIPNSEIRKDFNGIKGKSGTVEVTYTLTNVSSRAISACFEGFNGVEQDQTVVTPAPILANLSLTVPKGVTSFTAPGSTLSTSNKGVKAEWTPILFEPLGSLKQSLSVTMTSRNLSVPRATMELFTLAPESITGQAPATTAKALGAAEADVSKGISAVQGALTSLQQRMSTFQASRSSKGSSGGSGGGLGPVSLPKFSGQGISLPEISLPSLSLPSFSLPSVNLPSSNQQLSALNALSLPAITMPAITLPNIPTADFATVQAELATLGNHLDPPAVNRELASLNALVASLAKNAPVAVADAKAVVTLATRVESAVTPVTKAADAFLSAPVQNALKELLGDKLQQTISTDLAGCAGEPMDSAFAKVCTDLTEVQSLANTIRSAYTDLEDRAQNFAGSLKALQGDLSSLAGKANALETIATNAVATQAQRLQVAEAAVSNDVQARVAKAQTTVNGLEAKVAGIQTAAEQAVAGAKSTATQALNTAEANASQALDNAKSTAGQAVANATAKASQAQAAASQAIASAKATVNQDVATAAQQAQQSIQSSQAAAQSNLAKATSQGQSVLAKANADYAYLLSLNEQAELNQLPEGSATGATVQNGIFLFLIEGS